MSVIETPVRDVMSPKVKTIDAKKTIGDCLRAMSAAEVGCLVVMEGKRPVGIFTEKDAVKRLATGPSASKLQLSKVMSAPLVSGQAMDTIWDAIAMMSKRDIRRLPVIEDNRLVGIITEHDILLRSFNYYHGMIG